MSLPTWNGSSKREAGSLMGGGGYNLASGGVELLNVLVHGSETNRLINISLD